MPFTRCPHLHPEEKGGAGKGKRGPSGPRSTRRNQKSLALNRLYRAAIDGILGDLGDPNTSFMPASDADDFRIRMEGEYGGVGLEVIERDGWVTVVTPLPGTPGTRAGIRAGIRA